LINGFFAVGSEVKQFQPMNKKCEPKK